MKTYSLSEIDRIVNGGAYRHVGLFTSDGKTLIAFNSIVPDRVKKWKEIKNRLNSDGLPDALYIIRAKNVNSKEAIPDQFVYKKGTPDNISVVAPAITEKVSLSEKPNVLSWENALKLTTENERLKSENERLKKDLEFAEERISEMEEGLSEAEESKGSQLLDGTKSLLEGLMPTIVPLAEQFFSFRDRELKLKEIQQNFDLVKYQRSIASPGSPAPGSSAPGSPVPREEQIPDRDKDPIAFMKYLANLGQTDPEKYESIISTLK